jgi:hypothetical protein
MKKTALLLSFACNMLTSYAQDTIKLKDLAVPNSPAFILTDATPSLVQTPNTPKAFVLGIAQSFQQSTGGFPQDYSVEFAPYWWFKSVKNDVYTMLGLKTTRDAKNTILSVDGENPFAGLKFTSFSLAFLNKDLIPDTIKTAHKIISAGIRTTLVKMHLKNYAADLNKKLNYWHSLTQSEIDLDLQTELARAGSDPEKRKEAQDKIKAKYSKSSKTGEIVKEINDIVNQKPIFSWDLAAAYASYGINDSAWKSGRFGIWTTLSSYIPLAIGNEKVNKNYFNLNFLVRYLTDNYQLDAKGAISKNNNLDIGGKIAFELDKVSIGVESLKRYSNGIANPQNRTVGVISYKVSDNIYLNGSFGKNFDFPNKLISQLGINWGFGSEKASLPTQ